MGNVIGFYTSVFYEKAKRKSVKKIKPLVKPFGIWYNRIMKILVSACLLGENCKYNGKNNFKQTVADFLIGKQVIPVCPEVLAGLGTPRTPVEIVDGEVKTKDGVSVDKVLREAAQKVVALALAEGATCAILQSRSPTCGVKQVYDGSFSGVLVDGQGVLASALSAAGITLIDAEDVQ